MRTPRGASETFGGPSARAGRDERTRWMQLAAQSRAAASGSRRRRVGANNGMGGYSGTGAHGPASRGSDTIHDSGGPSGAAGWDHGSETLLRVRAGAGGGISLFYGAHGAAAGNRGIRAE